MSSEITKNRSETLGTTRNLVDKWSETLGNTRIRSELLGIAWNRSETVGEGKVLQRVGNHNMHIESSILNGF